MAPLASITLLAGAHKTASTHLQSTLLAQRARLADEGVGLIGPREVRAHLRAAMQPTGLAAAETRALAQAAFAQLCPGARHIVVMEENTLGATFRPFLLGPKGLLYPFAGKRLGEAWSAFAGRELRLGLAIRNPATFLPSCWSEQLLHGEWQSFRDYVQGVPPGVPRWSSLVNRVLAVQPELSFWTYEDYPAVLPQIIDWATGLAGFGAACPPHAERPRPGLSAKAAEILHRKMAAEPSRDHKRMARRARWAAPLGPGIAPFRPWTEAERSRLDAAYAEDLRALATLAGVRRLAPAPPQAPLAAPALAA